MSATEPWAGHERGTRAYRRVLFALFLAGFATFAQIFDAQAILPAISADLGIGAASAATTITASTIGLAVSVLPWASVADRIGRTRAMKVSLLAAALLSVVTPLMPTFELLVAGRALTGLALGAVPGVSMAYLAEELHPKWVSVAAGTYVAGNTIGGIVGRLLAGGLSDLVGWRAGLVAVSIVSVALTAVFWFVTPTPYGFTPGQPQRYSWGFRVLAQLRDPVMLALYAQGFLLMGAFTIVYNFLSYRLIGQPFGLPAALVSMLFVVYLTGTVSSRVSGQLAGRVGHLRVMLTGDAVMAAGLLLLASESLPVVILGLVLFTVGCFGSHPVASGLTGQVAQVGRSQAVALYQLAWLTGTAVFSVVGGGVYDALGWRTLLLFVLTLTGAAALFAVVGLTWGRGHRPAIPR